MPAGQIKFRRKLFRRVHSVCFGINDYAGAELLGCINDAEAIDSLFNGNNTENESYNMVLSDPNRSEIFAAITEALSVLSVGDLLLIYGSGHGTVLNNDFYFLPKFADFDNTLGEGIVIYQLVKTLSERAKNGCKVLLIFDTCNAGKVNFDISTYQGEMHGGISCIFAAAPDENSFETKVDGVVRGIFTYHLEQGLKGRAIGYEYGSEDSKETEPRHGFVTLIDLFDYAYDKVTRERKQYPLLIGTIEPETVIREAS